MVVTKVTLELNPKTKMSSSTSLESQRRVKLYQQGPETWLDVGTGHATIQYRGVDIVLEIRSETDGE